MNRRILKDRNAVINAARQIINEKHNYLILDTETTGIGKNDVVIQIGIIDLDGKEILNSLIKPTKRKRISSNATNVNGITMSMLNNQPAFKEIVSHFNNLIRGKSILIYNAEYDGRLLAQTAQQDGILFDEFNAICLMKLYSMYVGKWSEEKNDYIYQKLPAGNHSVIGDCNASLKILKKMANTDLSEIPKRWFEFWKK